MRISVMAMTVVTTRRNANAPASKVADSTPVIGACGILNPVLRDCELVNRHKSALHASGAAITRPAHRFSFLRTLHCATCTKAQKCPFFCINLDPEGEECEERRKQAATGLDGDHDPAVVLQEEAGIVRNDTRLIRLRHIGEDHVHHANKHSSAMGVQE